MKRFFISLAAALAMLSPAKADEGMWLLPLIEKINADAIAGLGSRLTPDQIYSINHSSIKDAVVQFGGGCTGEIISDQGLLITNHHCGYSSIQSLSSEEHNYLEDGYWAMSLAEELPVPGLSVSFLREMIDITDIMNDEKKVEKKMVKEKKKNPDSAVQLVHFFNDNACYIVIYDVYRDVRFVGAPPATMGGFGGDTDNWMWPRHTCDFSMFRVYAAPDGSPAEYSEANVPLKPRHYLPISLKGVQEGDFAMIMGYPGRTQRYNTAAQLSEMLDINRIRIDARTVRQDVLWKAMRADEKISLQYASKYKSSSNGWKKWQGMEEAFAKLDVIERQQQREADLQEWISADPRRIEAYGGAVDSIAAVVAARKTAYEQSTLLNETLGQIELLRICHNPSERAYKDYDAGLDREVALTMLRHYSERVAPEYKLDITEEDIIAMFENSAYTSTETLEAATAAGADLDHDPAKELYSRFDRVRPVLQGLLDMGDDTMKEETKRYTAALLDYSGDSPVYPDANFTCRLTYGSVLGYEPKDGVVYKHYTTLKGVMEKENPAAYEFRVPAGVKELYEAADYGQYADADGTLHTCFLTNLDITGGNSGSPVMDADGNLVGLAFDGNWEAMSGDVIFEPELQRCICVDIRYVLFMMDKFGGAGYLLDEMTLVR